MSARQQMPERETCDRRFLTYKVKIQGNDTVWAAAFCDPGTSVRCVKLFVKISCTMLLRSRLKVLKALH